MNDADMRLTSQLRRQSLRQRLPADDAKVQGANGKGNGDAVSVKALLNRNNRVALRPVKVALFFKVYLKADLKVNRAVAEFGVYASPFLRVKSVNSGIQKIRSGTKLKPIPRLT